MYARGNIWGEKVARGNWRPGDKELGRDTGETGGAGSWRGTHRMPEASPEAQEEERVLGRHTRASGCQKFDADVLALLRSGPKV